MRKCLQIYSAIFSPWYKFRLSLPQPGKEIGMVFKRCRKYAQGFFAAQHPTDTIDCLGGIADKDDLAALRINESGDGLPRRLESLRYFLGQEIDRPVDIGDARRVEFGHSDYDLPRFLGSRRIIKVDHGLAVDCSFKAREISTYVQH